METVWKRKEKLHTNQLDLFLESGNVSSNFKWKGNEMDELASMELDSHEIASMALASIGLLVESYCEQGYCDPLMYRSVELAERMAKKLGHEELVIRLATAKMYAGETVEEMIVKNNIDIQRGAWS